MSFIIKVFAILLAPVLLYFNLDSKREDLKTMPPPTLCAGDYPDGHAFLIMGSDEIFLDHLPRIYHENHHYQLICTATFPDSVKQFYLEDA